MKNTRRWVRQVSHRVLHDRFEAGEMRVVVWPEEAEYERPCKIAFGGVKPEGQDDGVEPARDPIRRLRVPQIRAPQRLAQILDQGKGLTWVSGISASSPWGYLMRGHARILRQAWTLSRLL